MMTIFDNPIIMILLFCVGFALIFVPLSIAIFEGLTYLIKNLIEK